MIDMKCQEIVEKYAKMLKILAADIYITLKAPFLKENIHYFIFHNLIDISHE